MDSVLFTEAKAFEFFFEDFNGKNKAPRWFALNVLTHLNSILFKPGDMIIPYRSQVTDLILVTSGQCSLYGFFPHKENTVKVNVVDLPEQSWYGDF